MKIKVINPNTTMEMTEGIGEAARSVARAGTEIVAVSPEFGPASIESFYDEQVAACGVLDEVRKGEPVKASTPTSSPATATPASMPRAR